MESSRKNCQSYANAKTEVRLQIAEEHLLWSGKDSEKRAKFIWSDEVKINYIYLSRLFLIYYLLDS